MMKTKKWVGERENELSGGGGVSGKRVPLTPLTVRVLGGDASDRSGVDRL